MKPPGMKLKKEIHGNERMEIGAIQRRRPSIG
jgi:hypothetical protein